MESKITLRLPVIDFSNQEKEWELVKGQVREAVEEYGAFEATFDQAPDLKLRKALYQAFEQIFDLPLETKQQISYKKRNPFGYAGRPNYEGMSVDDEANDIEKVELGFTKILWPQGKPELSKTIQSFTEHISKFDVMVRRMILESFGLENYMDDHLGSSTYTLRVSKYTNPQNPESKLVLPSHQDLNMLTILCQLNYVDGLEVQTQDGEWINAKFSSPNSFIVIIGECLHVGWLNGRVPAPYHRVVLNADQERLSVGVFSGSKDGYIVEAPQEMVNEEHPLLYKPFDYRKYLEYLGQALATRKFQPTLKTYCGVGE